MNMDNNWTTVKNKRLQTIPNVIQKINNNLPIFSNRFDTISNLDINTMDINGVNKNQIKLNNDTNNDTTNEVIDDIVNENQIEIKGPLDNKMFIVFVTENGNGYSNPNDQKIVTFGYDEKTITNIFNILYLINRNNTNYKKILNINIVDYDMTILNFDHLNKYNELIDYTKTHTFSIEANNEQELSNLLIRFFESMINDSNIKQVLYSRRRKYINTRKQKVLFFLVKIFICKSYSIEYIKNNIFKNINIKIKLKINDIEFDKSNKLEQGIKKNNWINI